MIINKKNPTSNGQRHQIVLKKSLLSKNNRIVKSLLKGIKNVGGRSLSNGRITVRHIGGGCKRLYRQLNTTNNTTYSIVVSTFYDPQRNAFLSFNYDFIRNSFFFNTATDLVFPGSLVSCSSLSSDLKLGFRMKIKDIPTGSIIHSLSNSLYKIKYIKAAGTFGQLIQKDFVNCKVKLPSGKIVILSVETFATLGVVSNTSYNLIYVGKAGINRLKGNRPAVRGIAMNPVDHPHGGRTNGGRPSVTPWGKPTRGKPTKKI